MNALKQKARLAGFFYLVYFVLFFLADNGVHSTSVGTSNPTEVAIANIFLGVWLFPLGYLVYKSGFLPKILGILLLIDGAAILLWFFQAFFFPAYEFISYLFLAESFIAEASLCLWLLIKGARENPMALAEAAGGNRGSTSLR